MDNYCEIMDGQNELYSDLFYTVPVKGDFIELPAPEEGHPNIVEVWEVMSRMYIVGEQSWWIGVVKNG